MKNNKKGFGWFIGVPTYMLSTEIAIQLANWDWYNEKSLNRLYFHLALLIFFILLRLLIKYIWFSLKVKSTAKKEYKQKEKLKKEQEIKLIKKDLKKIDKLGSD